MEWDGKISQATLSCAATGRALAAGETFYSGLRLADGAFARVDFSADAWPAQDPAAFLSWWRQVVPHPERKARVLKLDAASLGRIFNDLKESSERPQHCFCYVVALCLARMKKLHLVAIERDERSPILVFEDRPNRATHRLRDPGMSSDEEEQVRRNLMDIISIDGDEASREIPATPT
jgi:hypothetical protein